MGKKYKRRLGEKEQRKIQKGCIYCLEYGKCNLEDECPYDLGPYKTYNDYCKSLPSADAMMRKMVGHSKDGEYDK
jgi:hypothetical protein